MGCGFHTNYRWTSFDYGQTHAWTWSLRIGTINGCAISLLETRSGYSTLNIRACGSGLAAVKRRWRHPEWTPTLERLCWPSGGPYVALSTGSCSLVVARSPLTSTVNNSIASLANSKETRTESTSSMTMPDLTSQSQLVKNCCSWARLPYPTHCTRRTGPPPITTCSVLWRTSCVTSGSTTRGTSKLVLRLSPTMSPWLCTREGSFLFPIVGGRSSILMAHASMRTN